MVTALGKREFGRHIGVSAPRVSALVKRGLPVLADGKIDLDVAIAWMRENVRQQAGFQDRGIHKILGGEPLKLQKRAASARKAPLPPEPPKASGRPALQARAVADGGLLDDECEALPYATAKAMRETFLARKAKLDYLAAHAKLLPAAEVESRWARLIAAARNRLLACPGRIGARIAHLSAVEIDAIAKEIRQALNELGEATCS